MRLHVHCVIQDRFSKNLRTTRQDVEIKAKLAWVIFKSVSHLKNITDDGIESAPKRHLFHQTKLDVFFLVFEPTLLVHVAS